MPVSQIELLQKGDPKPQLLCPLSGTPCTSLEVDFSDGTKSGSLNVTLAPLSGQLVITGANFAGQITDTTQWKPFGDDQLSLDDFSGAHMKITKVMVNGTPRPFNNPAKIRISFQ